MAIHNLNYNKITASNNPISEGQWQDATGLEVEDFVSQSLAKSVTTFDFSPATSKLVGYNAEGNIVSETTVVNSTPTYVPELEIVNIRINSNNNDLKDTQNIELNYPSLDKIEVGVRFLVKYEILGNYYYSITPQTLQVKLGNNTSIITGVKPNAQSEIDFVQYVDITDLVKGLGRGVSNGTLTASCTLSDQYVESSYKGKITIKRITLSYSNKSYVEGTTVSFDISGIESSEKGNYKLVYKDNSITKEAELTVENSVEIQLDAGVHRLYARIEHRASGDRFYSNWLQTNLIVDCNNIEGDAVAVINRVPTEIHNCSNALLYEICYAAGTNGGTIEINSYLSDTWDTFRNFPDSTLVPFNSTTLSLTREDKAGEKQFYSYFELETVGNVEARYIGFTINGQASVSYTDDGTTTRNYFTVAVVENPYNINNAFNHVSGSELNYSQINGSGSNVFNADNIQLQPGDGWCLDSKYTAFQVSASGQNLFKTPINLSSYLNTGFTFEFLVKTYNVNGTDPVLRIGNIWLGPGYVRVYHDPDPEKGYTLDSVFVNSKADFQKDEVTHIMITYAKEYRPSTYMETYNRLLKTDKANYQTSSSVRPYNVLKIFINGVINREIQLAESELKEGGKNFNLQINPVNSDLKIYGLRTYKKSFNYEEIQKNRISALLEADDKKTYYDHNDILNEKGQISLKKCFNKYNVLVYVLPKTDQPLYYGNKNAADAGNLNATLLVHYANPDLRNYNGRLWGGSYKAQGTSAKKYLIHNCQYNIKEGNFLTEAEIEANNGKVEGDDGYITPKNYYQLPGSDIKIKKLVGKVNYASSMQTHKQGACNTYDDAYKNVFSSSLDKAFPLGSGRKTCMENEFLYFYYNLTPDQTLDTITIKDTLDEAKFMGFQTWGSAKADDATYGYDKNSTPEYLLMEGADNGNPGANFKAPWAAFQTYDSTNKDLDKINQRIGDVTKTSYTEGLLIDDETIRYGKADDPWDIDYGASKWKEYYNETSNPVFQFNDKVLETTLPRFAKFYNAMYQYDFTSFISSGSIGITNEFDVAKYSEYKKYKIYISGRSLSVINSNDSRDNSVTTAKLWDVFRWDSVRNKWVPAGLHFGNTTESNGGTWESFNLGDVYDSYTENDEIYDKYINSGKLTPSLFGKSITKDDTWFTRYLLPAMKELYMCACEEYLDIEDVAFHQAMIRVLSGTDNRAKNIYLQIIGKVYENGEPTDKGDYKIRLMQDDLDTIFATDNNGQQNKEYYLLEPAFNQNTESRWGDNHSSFFYPFDMCYAEKINDYTGRIINYLLEESSVEDTNTALYNNFLRIQKYFPAIAYNHTAEIYYELAQTIFQGGTKLYTGDFSQLLNAYENNSVANPLSLSHGSSYEGEVQFLKDRLLLLSTLTKEGFGLQTSSQSLVSEGTGGSGESFTVRGNAKYINYFYPNYYTGTNFSLMLKDTRSSLISCDTLFNNQYVFPNSEYDKTVINSIAVPGEMYPITLIGPTLTGFAIYNTNLYKQIEITEGLDHLNTMVTFKNAAYVTIDGNTAHYKILNSEIKMSDHVPVVEELILTDVLFNNTVIDFRNCNRLRKLDLSGCSGIESIILPEGNKLNDITLPSCIKTLSIINNPNLNSILFEDGARLIGLSIDLNKVGNQFDVNDFLRNYYNFSDAEALTIIGDADLELDIATSISVLGAKVGMKGKYRIVQNGSLYPISYQLKKDLVKTFGNIDSEYNTAVFEYDVLPLQEAMYNNVIYGLRFVEGESNEYYPFDDLYFEYGNDVLVTDDGSLSITYQLDSKAPATVGENSGKVTVTGSTTNDSGYDFTIRVYRIDTAQPIILKGKIFFGYIAPKEGDFAYADGTFSKLVIKNKTIVGLVYATRDNPTDSSKTDLAILSTDTVYGTCGPDWYWYTNNNFNTNNEYGSDQQNIFNTLTDVLYNTNSSATPPLTDVGIYGSIYYSPYKVVDEITVPPDNINGSTSVSYPERSGKQNTYFYKTIANEHLRKFAMKDTTFLKYMKEKGFSDTSGNVGNLTTTQFEQVCSQFDHDLGIKSNIGSLKRGTYDQLLYPAFYKACLYEPEFADGEIVLDEYRKGNWYVPSVDEIRVLVAQRIRSTSTSTVDTVSETFWNSTNYTENTNNVFTMSNSSYFSGFLENLGSKTSGNTKVYSYGTSDVSTAQGCSIIYGETSNYSGEKKRCWVGMWNYSAANNGYGSFSSHPNCRRDIPLTLPLCCQITITKES